MDDALPHIIQSCVQFVHADRVPDAVQACMARRLMPLIHYIKQERRAMPWHLDAKMQAMHAQLDPIVASPPPVLPSCVQITMELLASMHEMLNMPAWPEYMNARAYIAHLACSSSSAIIHEVFNARSDSLMQRWILIQQLPKTKLVQALRSHTSESFGLLCNISILYLPVDASGYTCGYCIIEVDAISHVDEICQGIAKLSFPFDGEKTFEDAALTAYIESKSCQVVESTTWECPMCTLANDMAMNTCAICGTTNPTVESDDIQQDGWACMSCTLLNPWIQDICEVCGTACSETRPVEPEVVEVQDDHHRMTCVRLQDAFDAQDVRIDTFLRHRFLLSTSDCQLQPDIRKTIARKIHSVRSECGLAKDDPVPTQQWRGLVHEDVLLERMLLQRLGQQCANDPRLVVTWLHDHGMDMVCAFDAWI
jgi:hypothetical protein